MVDPTENASRSSETAWYHHIQEAAVVSYSEVRQRNKRIAIRRDEVPVEHEVSLPMPTLRWSVAAYACFAGPALRIPNQPLRLSTPDRWWAVRASDAALLAYALNAAVPFANTPQPAPIVVTKSGRSMREAHEDQKVLDELLTAASPQFFTRSAGDPALRTDVTAALSAVVPAAVVPWYRLLAPDFFSWLEGQAAHG